MTEKRFKFDNFDSKVEMLDLIDTQSEVISDLEKKNEQLKSKYKVLHTQYKDLKKFMENNFNDYLTREKLNRQIIKLSDENEQLKQRINSRLHFYRELYETINDNVIKRVIEDLEDILKR